MADGTTPAGAGHSGGAELTDKQKEALFFNHFGKIKPMKEKIASLTGDLRNLYKGAKADGFSKKDFDLAFSLEDANPKEIEERRRREDLIAQWMQVPLGAQAELFDRAPAVDRAFATGRVAGMKGEKLEPPYADQASEQAQEWIRGWHAGQAEIFAIRAPLLVPADGDDATEEADGEQDQAEQAAAEAQADAALAAHDAMMDREEATPAASEKPAPKPRRGKVRPVSYADEFRAKNGIGTEPPTHSTT